MGRKAFLQVSGELEDGTLSTVEFMLSGEENIPVSDQTLAQFIDEDTTTQSLAQSGSSWIDVEAEQKAHYNTIQALRAHTEVVGKDAVAEQKRREKKAWALWKKNQDWKQAPIVVDVEGYLKGKR